MNDKELNDKLDDIASALRGISKTMDFGLVMIILMLLILTLLQ